MWSVIDPKILLCGMWLCSKRKCSNFISGVEVGIEVEEDFKDLLYISVLLKSFTLNSYISWEIEKDTLSNYYLSSQKLKKVKILILFSMESTRHVFPQQLLFFSYFSISLCLVNSNSFLTNIYTSSLSLPISYSPQLAYFS